MLSTDIMSPLIAKLANLSFKDGVFLSRYKAARVTPLLKKPNLSPHEPANYRAIVVSVLYIFQNTRKTGFVQVATARHEVGKLLQALVTLSERPLHRDSSSESSQRHSEGSREQALDISSAFNAVDHATLTDRARTVPVRLSQYGPIAANSLLQVCYSGPGA